jgi:hypothetical protein
MPTSRQAMQAKNAAVSNVQAIHEKLNILFVLRSPGHTRPSAKPLAM